MIHLIYALADPRTYRIRYIGQTARSATVRYKDHCRKQTRNNHRTGWLNQLHSLGFRPIMIIIEECNKFNWAERETYWIKYYRDTLEYDLVNTTDGGEGTVGWNPSEETKAKIGQANKGRRSFLGKNHTEYSKQLISAANKGQQYRLGKKHTEETKRKIAEKAIGRTGFKMPYNAEHRHKISRAKAKLTEGQVIEIRNSKEKGCVLAKRFNVSDSTISLIKSRKLWAWVN